MFQSSISFFYKYHKYNPTLIDIIDNYCDYLDDKIKGSVFTIIADRAVNSTSNIYDKSQKCPKLVCTFDNRNI